MHGLRWTMIVATLAVQLCMWGLSSCGRRGLLRNR